MGKIKAIKVKQPSAADMLRKGKCYVRRLCDGTVDGETLGVWFRPDGWGYNVYVDMPGLGKFTSNTPLSEVLRKPAEVDFGFLGKVFHAVLRYLDGRVNVSVHGTAVHDLLCARVDEKPFAVFDVQVEGAACTAKEGKKGCVYAVSVASYYEDSGELTSHCAAFDTPEKAADWFEADWNEQAGFYGGRKLTKKAKAGFLASLKGKDGVAEAESPDGWGPWFQWKGVRNEL